MTMQLPPGLGFIPRKPGLAERLAGSVQEIASGLATSYAEQAKRKKLIESLPGQKKKTIAEQLTPEQQKAKDEQFKHLIQQHETTTGQKLSPQQIEMVRSNFIGNQPQPEEQEEISPEESYQTAQRLILEEQPELAKLYIERGKAGQKERAAKAAEVDRSYERHKEFTDKIRKDYEGFEYGTKPRLEQMQTLNDQELVSPLGAAVLEDLGIPLGFIADPASEAYQKLSQDLLKGLPETYGNRILKVEVDNFLKTIPTLLNSPEGRRIITANILKLGQMKEAYYNEMRRLQRSYIDSNKKMPADFEEIVFDNVRPQLNRINKEFVQIASIKAVPPGTVPYFNPQGGISFVPKELTAEADKTGKRVW